MIARRGLTLVEVVLAVAVLALIAVALVGWLRLAARATGTDMAAITAVGDRAAVLRLVRRDVAARVGAIEVVEDGWLQLQTLHAIGSEQPQLRAVWWQWDEAGTQLIRRVSDGPTGMRVVWRGPSSPQFQQDEDGWWLIWPQGRSDAQDRWLIMAKDDDT